MPECDAADRCRERLRSAGGLLGCSPIDWMRVGLRLPYRRGVSVLSTASLAAADTAMQRCDALAACSEEDGRITRRYLTPAMRAAHEQLAGWMRSAGLAPRTDAAGNLIGRRSAALQPGRKPKVLLLGSHLDSVPGAGRYDGVLGVTTALAAVEALGRDTALPFHVDVIGFSEEEGVRYATPYLGSRAIAGMFDLSLLTRTDAAGVRMEDAIRAFGQNPRLLPDAAYLPDEVIGFVETHLEQGPVLETAGLSLGAVSAVAGQSRLLLRLEGRTAHAGTQPMNDRKDALVAAVGIVAATRAEGLLRPGLQATVGRLDVKPNARNVVPGRVDLSLDVRHAEDAERNAAVARLLESAMDLAAAEGCELSVLEHESQSAIRLDPSLFKRCDRLLAELDQRGPALVSGAGHDAVIMAAAFPSALLFLRHPGGISHHPDEAAERDDVAVAVELLVRLMRELAA